jgi:hypothetical protein
MVGVLIIILLGGLIVLTGSFVENIGNLFTRAKYQLSYAHLEWKTMSVLQLQRQTHERLGLGTWSHATEMVPVTEKGDELGVLDIGDVKRPKFERADTLELMKKSEPTVSVQTVEEGGTSTS